MDPFADRTEAGCRLAAQLKALPLHDPVVLALPRGGVPVAVEVARALGAPMDLLIVRKIGAPFQPELALGALAEARREEPMGSDHEPGAEAAAPLYVDEGACRQHGLGLEVVEREAKAHRQELKRRVGLYRNGQPPLALKGRTVVVVDDGAATGATMHAALKALAPCEVRSVVVALPVAPAQTVADLARCCERIVCLTQPEPFVAVGLHYRRFPQVSDEEVMALMRVVKAVPSMGRSGLG